MNDTAPAPSTVLVSTRSTVPAALPEAYGSTPMELDLRVAKELANSDIVPAAYRGKPSNVLVAIGLGRALGLEPASSLYGMHVIEGTPSPTAKVQAALVRRAGHKLRIVEHSEEKAVVTIIRADDPDFPITTEFTVDDARRAGYLAISLEQWVKVEGRNKKQAYPLPDDFPVPCTEDDLKKAGAPAWAKPWMVKRRDNWHTNRKTMLHHRAVTQCVGMACPEVVSGLDFEITVDSDDDVVTADPVDVLTTPPAPDPAPAPDVVDAEVVEPTEAAELADTSAGEVADGAGRDDGPPEPPTGSATADSPAEPAAEEPPAKMTLTDLENAVKVAGKTKAATIQQAQAIAADIDGASLPGTLGQILASPEVLPKVLAWLQEDGEAL